jgi:hypothetical protein
VPEDIKKKYAEQMKKKRVKQITEIINQSNEKKKNKKIKSKGHGLKKTSEEIPQETGS